MLDNRKLKDIYKCESIKTEGEIYPLQKWYNGLIEKTISEIEIADVLRMIRQKQFMDIAIFKAVYYLEKNPFSGELYEGELLEKLSTVNKNDIIKYKNEIITILLDSLEKNKKYEWLEEEEREEFKDIIDDFYMKLL